MRAHYFYRRLQVAAFALLAIALAPPSYGGENTPKPAASSGKLRITGAGSLVPLVSEVARRFEESHPGVKIDVRGGGTARGLADLRSGASDIGMVAFSLGDRERDLFRFPIARDGIAVIVNAQNNLRALNSNTLSDILTGKITNWKALGGPDAALLLALGPEGGGSSEIFAQHLKLQHAQLAPHTPIITTEDAIAFVSKKPNGLAVGSIGVVERSARAGAPIKLIAYNGFPATSRTVENHLYALTRPLTLVSRGAPEGLQKQFIDYALSPTLIDLQLKYGFVPYRD
ncbi:MAG: substrate-binding domain-containing protein [Burkholderiales bacterium]